MGNSKFELRKMKIGSVGVGMNKFKHYKSLYSLMLIIVLVLTGCTSNNLTTETREPENNVATVKEEARVIRIGAVDYAPFYYFDDETFSGPTAEVLIEAFKRMDMDVEIKKYPWLRLLELMKSGDVDIIVDVFVNEERLKYLDYSSEKLITHYTSLFARLDSEIEFAGDLSELDSYSVGIVEGYYFGEDVSNAIADGRISVDRTDTTELNIEKLYNRRVDIIIELLAIGETMLMQLEYSDEIKALQPSIYTESSYLGFSKVNDLQETIKLYDETINEMRNDGTIDAIYDKYGVAY